MTFYLKPIASGSITYQKFQKFAQTRLYYLSTLRHYEIHAQLPEEFLPYADCLIGGSIKDRLSHFALRLISFMHPPLYSYVLQKEKLLFRRRIFRMDIKELEKSIKVLISQLAEYNEDEDYYESSRIGVGIPRRKCFFPEIQDVLREILGKGVLTHMSSISRDDDRCTLHKDTLLIGVPFKQVLPLLASREVTLSNGIAYLRCDQTMNYLTQIFCSLMDHGTEAMRSSSFQTQHQLIHDPRIQEILETLKFIYEKVMPSELTSNSKSLSLRQPLLKDLDSLSLNFPPCMRANHIALRSRHRLCHRPRVQYTLYLKEIGLSVSDFLRLLETEYSKEAVVVDRNQKHVCEHSWQKNKSKYIYGSRHLYGLEGKKTDYTAHSCKTIQGEAPGGNQCGGCPFVHFDEKNKQRFFNQDLMGPENATEFLKHIKDRKLNPIESCHAHLRFKTQILKSKNQTSYNSISQELQTMDNSQVKIHRVFKPRDYFDVISKLTDHDKT